VFSCKSFGAKIRQLSCSPRYALANRPSIYNDGDDGARHGGVRRNGGEGIYARDNISISGGNVTAKDNIYAIGFLSISGGHIIATTILGNPLSISGAETLVEADSINTTDFGGATVRLKKQ